MLKREVFWKNPGFKGFLPLKEDTECDYLIVGGGVTGISLAYFLQKLSKKNSIVLIDKNKIAGGATGRAAGILTPSAESDLKDLIKVYGQEKGLLYYYHLLSGLHQMKHIIKKEKIDCDFEEMPAIYAEYKYKLFNKIIDEYEIQKKLHMNVQLLVGKSLEKEVHTDFFKDAIHTHAGASINPLKYTQNLSKVLAKRGAKIYENTPLLSYKDNVAITPKANIKFKKIILATDTDSDSGKVIPIKSTIMVSQKLTKDDMSLMGLPHRDMLWDAKRDFNYLKLTKDNRILSGYGGKRVDKTENKTSVYEPHTKEIKSFLKKVFPKLNTGIEYVWSGTLGLHIGSFSFTDISFTPLIKFEDNRIKILGTAGQVPATMAAKYVANRLFNKKSPLDQFFA